MLFAWPLILLTMQTQAVRNDLVVPDVKRCPDGSTILVAQQCLPALDHRYLLAHEPTRTTTVRRWWCGRSAQPSEATFTIEQPRFPSTKANRGVVRLEDLKVSGQAASAALLRTVRAGIANAEGTYELAGWCLNVEGHGVVPVLLLRQSTGGEQRSTEIVLR